MLQLAIIASGSYIKIIIKSDVSTFSSVRVICNHQCKVESQEITNTNFKREEDMTEKFTQIDNTRITSVIVVDFIANIIYNIYNAVSGILLKRLSIGLTQSQNCRTIRTVYVIMLQLAIIASGSYIKIIIKSNCIIFSFF